MREGPRRDSDARKATGVLIGLAFDTVSRPDMMAEAEAFHVHRNRPFALDSFRLVTSAAHGPPAATMVLLPNTHLE